MNMVEANGRVESEVASLFAFEEWPGHGRSSFAQCTCFEPPSILHALCSIYPTPFPSDFPSPHPQKCFPSNRKASRENLRAPNIMCPETQSSRRGLVTLGGSTRHTYYLRTIKHLKEGARQPRGYVWRIGDMKGRQRRR